MITSRSSSVPSLTVRDIAKRIRRDDEDLEVVVNRLRNWTKEGLLQFLGDKHPGTGKTRFYPEYAVIDALVLSALTATGIPAVRAGSAAGPYMSVLNYGRLGHEHFPEKEAAGEEIFLMIGAEASIYDGANPHLVDLCYGRDGLSKTQLIAASDVIITVNLSNLFRRLQKRMGEA
jgi:hypothetical protein